MDFLFAMRDRCVAIPQGIEVETWSQLARGEGEPRSRGPSGPMGMDERWKSGGRMPSGPMGGPGGQGGGQGGYRGGPPPGMRMSTGPLPALHKTGSAYKVRRGWMQWVGWEGALGGSPSVLASQPVAGPRQLCKLSLSFPVSQGS